MARQAQCALLTHFVLAKTTRSWILLRNTLFRLKAQPCPGKDPQNTQQTVNDQNDWTC